MMDVLRSSSRKEDEDVVSDVNNSKEAGFDGNVVLEEIIACKADGVGRNDGCSVLVDVNSGGESGFGGGFDAVVVLEESVACKVIGVGNDGCSVLVSRVNVDARICNTGKGRGVGNSDFCSVLVSPVNDDEEGVDCVDAQNCNMGKGGGVCSDGCNGEGVDNVQSPLMSSITIEESVGGDSKKGDEVVVNVSNEIERKSNSCEELGCNGEESKNLDSSLHVGRVDGDGEEVGGGNNDDCDGEQVDCVDARNCNMWEGGGVDSDSCNGEGVDGVQNPLMSIISIEGSVEGEGKKGDEVVLANLSNEIEPKSNSCEALGCNGSLGVSDLRVVEESKNLDSSLPVSRVDDGNDNDCVDVQKCNGNVNNGNAEQEDNVQTEGWVGRKRKSPQSIGIKGSGEVEAKKDDETVLANATNEIEQKSGSCEELGCKGSLDAILVPELRVDEENKNLDSSLPVACVNVNGVKMDDVNGNNCNGEPGGGVDARNCKPEQEDGGSADNCNGEKANDDNDNNGNGEQAGNGSKGRRGRKRKNPQMSSNAQIAEMTGGVSADNCNGEQANEDNANNGNRQQADNGTKRKRGRKRKNLQISSNAQMAEMTDAVSTDNCNVEQQANDDNANNDNGVQADKGTKGRRGRKRKSPQMAEMFDLNEMPVVQLSGRVLRSRTVAVRGNDLVKGDLSDAEDKIDEEIDEIDSKAMLENVEDKNAEPSRRGKKKEKNKGRCRRPRINLENEDAVVTTENKYKVLGSKQSLESGTSLSKVKGGSVASEKKDIRNNILDMVLRCGWKLIFVPRVSKDYSDPVYVDPAGKTHWSITKAYKFLKERIDSDEANDVERAGFTEIPDETLSKLFRVTTKKRSDCGVKRSVGVEEKELVRNISSSKKADHSDCEEKSNIGQKSRGRKRKSVPLEGRKKKRFALLARGSKNRSDLDDDESELYSKKRNLLAWMIDLGTVPEGENVQYRDAANGGALLEGKVTRDGLSCNCCKEMHTILGFQLHAGRKFGERLKNIYLGSGQSTFHCMVDSWIQQVELSKIEFCTVNVASSDHNDDTCNICGDGGNLMCCDCCPSTFHLSCLDIEEVPAGEWHCMYCTCKFCRSVGDEAFSQDDGNHLITCQLCEEKFHSTCTDQTDAESVNSAITSFCGARCQKIFNWLQKFVGLKHEMEGGLSWTILQRYDVGNDASLSDYPLKIECNAKLAVAYSVMDECFFPVVDPRSQSEMISNVIYNCGSNFRRLNYSGFYTFILEKGDEVVSTASIRFHGTQLAEMPFIATRNIYRRQGFSRQLLTVIEKALSSMGIQKLIIPAVSDVKAMWTDSFGFLPLEKATWKEMKAMSIIVFPGTDMLQKPLLRPTDEQAADSSERKGEEEM